MHEALFAYQPTYYEHTQISTQHKDFCQLSMPQDIHQPSPSRHTHECANAVAYLGREMAVS